MSGIVGLLNLDGEPVDKALLHLMTESMAFRGPDARETWTAGPIGFGHAMLRTTREAQQESQPTSLAGEVWITADARLDARAELLDRLESKSEGRLEAANDAELILHAYRAWGEACIDYLLGDFAFAIWDSGKRLLFCARDHFGVKPFFYSHMGSCFIVSNTLNCIRQHPAISRRLNDLAIANFLLDMNQDPSITSFVDIQRLPPAHVLRVERGALSVRRYWRLAVTEPSQYKRDEEYLERFRELLDAAVVDRLRTDSAGIMMSGGLDSTTVAASAQRIFRRSGNSSSLCAYTEVFDSLIPHEERHYATLTANALGIPIEYLVSDDRKIFEGADLPEYQKPEPINAALTDTTVDQLLQIAAHSRVVLTGYGADPALCGRITVHFRQLVAARKFSRILTDATGYLSVQGRFSRLYLRKRWKILFNSTSWAPVYPGWLNEDLEKRLCLRDRWMRSTPTAVPSAAVRPEANAMLFDPVWPNLFELHDPGASHVPVEVRHPIFDLRLLNFLVALPRLPWCADKELLREAAREVLPDAVRLRRKSPLLMDPLKATLQLPESAWVDHFEPVPELEQYVVRTQIPTVFGEQNAGAAWLHLRPLSLDFWLRGELT